MFERLFYILADSDDEYIEEEPDLETSMIKHDGGVNRIRVSVD